jgi:hypothetical protein
MISSSFHVILTGEEVLQFVSRLFSKDLPIAPPASVLEPYCSENPPPSVRINDVFVLLSLCC